jgi:hypothetical protein
MASAHLLTRPRPHLPTFRWQWCLPVLGLALLVRLIWLFAPFTYDPTTITACMRAMTHGGITEVLATVQDRIHMPLELYLLLPAGWFSQGAATGSAPTLIEMLALRLSLVFTDVLAVAAIYRMGRKTATAAVALAAAVLYALWPGGIYVDSWWTQTDVWYVVPMVFAAWWLARGKVELAWMALALGVGVKWQAAMVMPVFLVGTWRWRGWRGLARGLVAAGAVWALLAAPIVLNGQVSQFLAKSMVQLLPPFVVEKAQNFWFAVVPLTRVMQDQSLDLNPWLGGVSYHDAGLVFVAVFQAVIAGRLFWRSGPRAVASASALAVLATTMFSTQVSTRHYLAVPALFLLAGLFDRKWWGLFALSATTQIINLVWESGQGSPLRWLMPIGPDLAAANAWANLTLLALALGLFVWPLFRPPARQARTEGPLQAMRPPFEPALLGLGALTLVIGAAAYLWAGREMGLPILSQHEPLVASLQDALAGATPDDIPNERILAINWPWKIETAHPRWLGVLPITPPALVFEWPYGWAANVTHVQFPPWQGSAPHTLVNFREDVADANALRELVLQADRVVTYRPASNQMVLLAQRWPTSPSPDCQARFGPSLCLVNATASQSGRDLRLDLSWQAPQALPPGLTVSVRLTNSDGAVLAQADGDPLQGLVPLAQWAPSQGARREVRYITPPAASDYQMWVSVVDKTTGDRLPATCLPSAVCDADSMQVVVHTP